MTNIKAQRESLGRNVKYRSDAEGVEQFRNNVARFQRGGMSLA
jgi:hypothetical protein